MSDLSYSCERKVLFRVFGFGVMGAVFGMFLVGGACVALLQNSTVQQEVRVWLSSLASSSSAAPIVDSSGGVDPIVSVAAEGSPAVVAIVVSKEVPTLERTYQRFSPFGGSFSGFMIPQYQQNGTHEEEIASGTGFFISDDGYLVTNNHVIDVDESSYKVYLNDGSSYDATLIASDDVLDVALLKVDASDVLFPHLSFGDSDSVQVGQTAIAIGNALGEYHNTVSVGVISGLSRSLYAETGDGGAEYLQDILQTDAAINSGNSGGPLLDLAGNVIGVNVAASVGTAENIGFALPANAVQFAVDSMKENGRVVRPWLGVRYEPITAELVDQEGLSVDYGALVRRGSQNELAVIPGSPADKAGIEENDIILSLDGEDVNESHDLGYLLRLRAPGDSVTLTVLHDGDTVTRTVILEERPAE